MAYLSAVVVSIALALSAVTLMSEVDTVTYIPLNALPVPIVADDGAPRSASAEQIGRKR